MTDTDWRLRSDFVTESYHDPLDPVEQPPVEQPERHEYIDLERKDDEPPKRPRRR